MPHGYARAGSGGKLVAAVADDARVDEGLVQVVHVLDHPPAHGAGDADEVEDRLVLGVLAEADSAGVRADRHAELCREEQHGHDLVHAPQPARVNLAVRLRAALEQLLEDDPVWAVLAGGDPYGQRLEGRRYRRMDEVGTPFCITVDSETTTNDSVTVRQRDTMTQERVNLADLRTYLEARIGE